MNGKGIVAGVGALTLVGLMGVAGRGSRAESPAPPRKSVPAPSPAAAKQGAVVVHLVLRDRRVTIRAGHLYTVTSRDGKVLAENVSLKRLKAIDPGLAQQLERTVAAPGTLMWAGD
jgi:hypothetical protein